MVVGLFYGGCGSVGGGCAVLVVLCWHWIVFFFFFLVQLLGFVVVAGGPTVGWMSVAPLEWVLGQWVAAWVCCLGFCFLFWFFFFLGVDGRLWVASGGGGGGVRCM